MEWRLAGPWPAVRWGRLAIGWEAGGSTAEQCVCWVWLHGGRGGWRKGGLWGKENAWLESFLWRHVVGAWRASCLGVMPAPGRGP